MSTDVQNPWREEGGGGADQRKIGCGWKKPCTLPSVTPTPPPAARIYKIGRRSEPLRTQQPLRSQAPVLPLPVGTSSVLYCASSLQLQYLPYFSSPTLTQWAGRTVIQFPRLYRVYGGFLSFVDVKQWSNI